MAGAMVVEEAEGIDSLIDLRRLALGNFYAEFPEVSYHEFDSVCMVTAGGYYELTLLLTDPLWDERQIEVDGEYVVAIPNRDLLFVTGSENEKGMRALRGLVERNFGEVADPVSEVILIRKDGVWKEIVAEQRPAKN